MLRDSQTAANPPKADIEVGKDGSKRSLDMTLECCNRSPLRSHTRIGFEGTYC